MKVNYDYITNVIDYDYDYIASESHDYDYDYDYLRSCNRLQSITITDYDYPIPDRNGFYTLRTFQPRNNYPTTCTQNINETL